MGSAGMVGLNGGIVAGANSLYTNYMDAGVFTKNAFFGAETLQTTNLSSGYSSYNKGPGPSTTLDTMFHDPDHAGTGGGSGAVGFANYAGGDYTVSGDYATAATDGTMLGCDIATRTPLWTKATNGTYA